MAKPDSESAGRSKQPASGAGSLSITGPLTPISQKLYGLFAAEGNSPARDDGISLCRLRPARFFDYGATGFAHPASALC